MTADAAFTALPELRRRGAIPRAGRCPYCQRAAGDGQLPVLLRADVRRRRASATKCGAARARAEADDAAAPAARPAAASCSASTSGATAMLECAACDGVWVDADVFERICADREAQAAVLHRLAPQPRARRQPVPRCSYRPCLAVRQDDEPRELRQAVGRGRRRLPGARHVPRRRRAASDRDVHPRAGSSARGREKLEELREEQRKAPTNSARPCASAASARQRAVSDRRQRLRRPMDLRAGRRTITRDERCSR